MHRNVGWQSGSSSREPVYKAQGPELKTQYHQKCIEMCFLVVASIQLYRERDSVVIVIYAYYWTFYIIYGKFSYIKKLKFPHFKSFMVKIFFFLIRVHSSYRGVSL
jgi:hypothetical protein